MTCGMRVNHTTGETVYLIDGHEVSKAEFDKRTPSRTNELVAAGGRDRSNRRTNCWPMVSDAAGVHPTDAKRAAKHASAVGVPTEFNSDGNPVFTDKHHRRRFLEAHHMYDRNAGHGDPTPK